MTIDASYTGGAEAGGMETVLITGCSSGIGDATARAFLDEEWRVYATSRDLDDVADLAEAGCETAALDVTDGAQIEAVVDRILDETGRLDCLVNNAGYAQLGPLEDLPVDEIRREFDVNTFGPARLARAVLPHMRERGDGTIVNVSSTAGRVSFPGGGAYAGSKFALEAMSDALRAEVSSFGVDVVLVEPAGVESRFAERTDDELPHEIDRTDGYGVLYRLIEDSQLVGGQAPLASQPEDVAAAILQAGSCTDPAARYPVGALARPIMFARFLPSRWRDAAYRLVSRLLQARGDDA